jgi:hypothetical protein
LKQDTPESERLKPNIFEVASSSPWWSNAQNNHVDSHATFEPTQSILGNDVDSHVTFEPARSIMGNEAPIKEIENQNSSHSRFDSRSVNIDKGLIDTLLISLPKQLKDKAKSILQYILEKTPIIWNEKGEISIRNKRIPFSNIVDLVKDALLVYNHFKPIGWVHYIPNAPASVCCVTALL